MTNEQHKCEHESLYIRSKGLMGETFSLVDECPYCANEQLLEQLKKYKVFFKTIAHLTANHGVAYAEGPDGGLIDIASVSPQDLDEALETIDHDWWRQLIIDDGS